MRELATAIGHASGSPCSSRTPFAREKDLDFVEDLIRSNHPNLFISVTSRPEQDIQTVLSPLTPAWRRVSFHGEASQDGYQQLCPLFRSGMSVLHLRIALSQINAEMENRCQRTVIVLVINIFRIDRVGSTRTKRERARAIQFPNVTSG